MKAEAARRAFGRLLTQGMAATALAVVGAVAPVCAQGEPTMLEETAEAPYALAATLHVAEPEALRFQVLLDYQDDANCYAITCSAREVEVERFVNGEVTTIGQTRAYGGFEEDAELELTVRRDGWRMELILNRQVLARAWDDTLSGGKVGYAVTGGEIADPMIQPLGGVYMTDDFMRTAHARSVWEQVQGTWKTQSLRVDEQSDRMEADKAANAFSYWGKGGDGAGIATTGYWFWDNYSVSTAVRPAGNDPLGLIAYFQGPENYILARWTSALSDAGDADRLELIAVQGGQRALLAEAPGGHLPGQWFRLQLRICDGLIQCFVDDEPRLAARADLFGQGQPGLYCEGNQGTFFDSVIVEAWEVLAEEFETAVPGKWVQAGGIWEIEGGLARGSGQEAALLSGRREWSRYSMAADLQARGRAGVGLVVCAGDEGSYAMRIGVKGSGVDYEGQAQIVRRQGGETAVLSTAPAAIAPGGWHRAEVVVDEGLITGYLDGKRVLDAWDAGARSGRIGLQVDGGGEGLFDNVYVTMLPSPRIARVAKEFTEGDEHWEMVEWASTRAPWLKPEDEESGVWWTKGEYFGDKSIVFEIPRVAASAGEVTVRLDAEPDEAGSGLTLIIATERGAASLNVALLAGDEQIGETTVEVESDPCPVRFERKGTWVVVTIDGKVVFNEKR